KGRGCHDPSDTRAAQVIEAIQLKSFRGFDRVTLPIRPLTILFGPNSSGKSSFTQSLVALRDVHRAGLAEPDLTSDIVARDVDLGTYSDLRHRVSHGAHRAEGDIEIALQLGKHFVRYGFGNP